MPDSGALPQSASETSTVYLNHAGTTWPKPSAVIKACEAELRTEVWQWPERFDSAHRALARFFGVSPERLLLTPGCTSAISLALSHLAWQAGDCVLTSAWEHHAMSGALQVLARRGIDVIVLPPSNESPVCLDRLESILKERPIKLVAMTAACNVTGERLPIESVIELSQRFETLTLIDGAQVVGWESIDLPQLGCSMFAFGSHKGLHGPWGIGGLYVADEVVMDVPSATCEIGASERTASESGRSESGSGAATKCNVMPGYCDAGSVDRLALSGLHAALGWLQPEANLRLALARVETLRAVIDELDHSTLYRQDAERLLPTIAFNLNGVASSQVAAHLAEQQIIVASGLQCAPSAHSMLGTEEQGVVRISIGPMNSEDDINRACNGLRQLSKLR